MLSQEVYQKDEDNLINNDLIQKSYENIKYLLKHFDNDTTEWLNEINEALSYNQPSTIDKLKELSLGHSNKNNFYEILETIQHDIDKYHIIENIELENNNENNLKMQLQKDFQGVLNTVELGIHNIYI